ncbi:MAG: M15 family metallopeptidase [Paenirhodobacter sp.]|uniref:M15 family metallopeptidase n=1 Tax=Paenirhodobacter sp. TaxID=1965326 RepID=UPI003D0E856F
MVLRQWLRAGVLTCLGLAAPAAAQPPQKGFVRLSDVAPGIAQDIRYAGPYNFTGARVPGYEAPECLLTSAAAGALLRAERALRPAGLRLVVYDCYRPAGAVRHFAAWVRAAGAPAYNPAFFPEVARRDLVRQGYISDRSSHSRGSTVDVGLLALGEEPPRMRANGAPCDAPHGQRPLESSIDMGTNFDCFSPRSAQEAASSPEAARNRRTLSAAMARAGFRPYALEWWHFTLRDEPFPGTQFEFPVTREAL